jgi:hypothetical protein
VFGMETRLARSKAGLGPPPAEIIDTVPWDWYAETCSCGLPPGECRVHPRARPTQRPPEGDWRVWAYVAGRGAGETRAGAAWIQRRVDQGTMKIGCLIAPTAADIRDVMVEGPSGLINVAPAWSRPRFESSAEDFLDALRGGIRDALPVGALIVPSIPRIHASRIF